MTGPADGGCEGKIFQEIHTKPDAPKIPTYEIIVGPRYRIEDMRPSATRTIVLEVDASPGWPNQATPPSDLHKTKSIPKPVAGPIVREITQCWGSGTQVPRMHYARCLGCGDASKNYRRKNELALWQWAHRHRCPPSKP